MSKTFVVMSREVSYGGCNCSCFETDEVFGTFSSEIEAEKWAKKKFKGLINYYRIREIRSINS